MAEKKSIIDEAIMDYNKVQNAIKANSKEMLRSLVKEEIGGYMDESITEEDEDFEEIDIDTDGNELPTADITDAPEAELPAVDDLDLDMTAASDEDVISVFKKINTSDEIEVVSDTEVKFKPQEAGAEYIIKMNAPTATPANDVEDIDLGIEDLGDEDGEETEFEIALDGDEEADEEGGEEFEIDTEEAPEGEGEVEGSEEGETETEDSEDEDEVKGESVVYEIELQGDEETEDKEEIEEKIQVGKGRSVANTSTDIKGAGGKSNNVKAPNVTANESLKLKYDALVKEATQLKAENEEFKDMLKKFRSQLNETVVFNANLAYVVKLFTEHTTTKDEKKQIIARFDNGVSSLKESKNLYKSIVTELSSKKSVTESVAEKINKDVTSSKTQLTESTAYADKSTQRIKELMYRQMHQ